MKLAVIGLGLIGGSLSVDLKRLGFAEEVIGVDNDLAHCKQALDLSLVDRIGSLESDLQTVDMVILAVPVDAILKVLPKILDLVKSSTTVIDMGSTKELICQAVEGHKNRKQFVPSHPMAGSENSGPSAAVAGLFFKKTAIICDPSQSDEYHLSRAKNLYSLFSSSYETDLYVSSRT
jgi:prephenate dehydrogenase